MTTRPPIARFTRESAIQQGRLAEDDWNSRDPEKTRSSLRATFQLEKPLAISLPMDE